VTPSASKYPLLDALMGVLFAPTCAVCSTPLEFPTLGAVCGGCWTSIQPQTGPLCESCGDVLSSWRSADSRRLCHRCARRRRVVAAGRAIGPYEGTLREVLHALKYDGRRSLARPLAELMTTSGHEVIAGADLVIPVPLHFRRYYRRGFNQAYELARHLELPCVRALKRRRATVTQTDLPEAERHRNVTGAFAVRRAARRSVRGSVALLVDDVSTTGATLDACAAALLEAGAREVRALTAARAASRLP
jgi:ComF family protein